MKGSKNLLPLVVLVAICFVFASPVSKASDIYVAQNAAGSINGADCADAYATTWFNTAANWGSGAKQIGPGTTVHLCGTLTSAITANGSGTSGSPITIAFDCASNGQITMPAIPANGAIIISGLSYITIDGQSCGIIQSTNNGSPSGGYANQIGSQAIVATNVTNVEVKNLQCINLYMHIPPDQTSWGAPYPVCVNFTGTSTSNVTIDNNTFHDCAWCAWGEAPNVSFHDNTIYNFDHGLGMGIQSDAGSVMGPVYFYNNSLSNATTWDTGTVDEYHHDGLHLWAYCSNGSTYCAGTYWNDVYVYNNHFYGNWGPLNTTAHVFFEGNVHNSWIFNNLDDCTANQCDDGIYSIQGSNVSSVINNTLVAGPTQSTPDLILGGPAITVQNNVVSSANELISVNTTDQGGLNNSTVSALGNNAYMAGGSNAFVWHGTFLSFSQFSNWESVSGDKNSVTGSTSTVTLPAGTLQTGSPAIGAGTNLNSLCQGQPNPGLGALCSDASGTPRPTSGAWDAGAFSFGAASAPGAPANLTGVVGP